jgi:ribonuclease HI
MEGSGAAPDGGDGAGQGEVVLYTDGAARGNPGEAGIGVVVCAPDGTVREEIGEYLGQATNNVAEYRALIRGLERARAAGARRVLVYSDSELMVRQMNGQYRVRNEGLAPLHRQATLLARSFERVDIVHVARERNRRADALANRAIDEAVRRGEAGTAVR